MLLNASRGIGFEDVLGGGLEHMYVDLSGFVEVQIGLHPG